jgi:ketosteroid isomerase-like protein
LAAALTLLGCATPPHGAPDIRVAQDQVFATERAFARTLHDRDLAAFASFVSDEAVFFSGTQVLRGKQRVVDAWAVYYRGPTPPFSWQPQDVEVLDSGQLALSSGPVHDSNGKLIATFTSIWRQESPGVWRIVFDKGNKACACDVAQK